MTLLDHPSKEEIAQYCIDNDISILINIGIDFDKRRIYPALGLKEREDGEGLIGMHCILTGNYTIIDYSLPNTRVCTNCAHYSPTDNREYKGICLEHKLFLHEPDRIDCGAYRCHP